MIWDDARVFLAVARSGTLTEAARNIGGGVATVSRRIERMEATLGVPLFIRHQSGYRLTDEGEALLPRAEAIEEACEKFTIEARHESEAIGRVRLATAENLANRLIIPSLPGLLHRHPRLELDIVTDVASVNLHRRDADLAVRMIKPERGNVTVRKLGTMGLGLYASKAYAAGRVDMPDQAGMDNDSFIGWSEAQSHLPAARWIDRVLRGRPAALLTSTLSAQVTAAQSGLGFALLPHFLARPAGLHQHPVETGVEQPVWLVIHTDLAASRRVRIVADHLVDLIHQHRDELAG